MTEPRFDTSRLQTAMGQPATFDRAGRVKAIKEAAEFLKRSGFVFVGEALLAWLAEGDGDLARDYFKITVAGSHVTPSRLYHQVLLDEEDKPENPELPSPPSTSTGERK